MGISRDIAEMYDRRIDESLAHEASEEARLFFDHTGMLFPNEFLKEARERIDEGKNVLEELRDMQMKQVRYGMMFLGYPSPDDRLLDAGCGAGGPAIMLHQEHGMTIDGFTLSEREVEYANDAAEHHGCSDEVRFYPGDMLNLEDVDDNTYDLIWADESTEHVYRLPMMFEVFGRAAKARARMIILAAATDDEKLKSSLDRRNNYRISSEEGYLEAAAENGWTLITSEDLSERVIPYWRLRNETPVSTGIEELILDAVDDGRYKYNLFAFEYAGKF